MAIILPPKHERLIGHLVVHGGFVAGLLLRKDIGEAMAEKLDHFLQCLHACVVRFRQTLEHLALLLRQ